MTRDTVAEISVKDLLKSQRQRFSWWVPIVCSLLVVIPFAFVEFPPIADLPQQVAQIRLFQETLQNSGESPYQIQWFTPSTLSYFIMGISWLAFGPAASGRVAMAALGVLWALSIYLVAVRRKRPPAASVLATLFFFNHTVYWGFYGFVVGWPVFLFWFELTTENQAESFSFRQLSKFLAIGVLLYVSHVLWLLAGTAWLIIHGLVFRRSMRSLLLRVGYLTPLLVAVALWYPLLHGSRMETPPVWGTDLLSRLSFSWVGDAMLGGLRGHAEDIILVIAIAWIVLSVRRSWTEFAAETDWEMLLCAGMLLAFTLALPDRYMNTIRFEQRWAPAAMIMLTMAVPGPSLRSAVRELAALLVLAAFCAYTTLAWIAFEEKELSGLKTALFALPPSPKVLGLSLFQGSEIVRGFPFVQTFAYSQALKGGTLNFSFAEFPSCLVVYKERSDRSWTRGLEWFPGRFKESDLQYFDFVLINGPESEHSWVVTGLGLDPMTHDGRWRLYKIPFKYRKSAERLSLTEGGFSLDTIAKHC
jgi:hypothetical protein